MTLLLMKATGSINVAFRGQKIMEYQRVTDCFFFNMCLN